MLFKDEYSPFSVLTNEEFNSLAIDLFRYQAQYNKVYREYLEALNIDPTVIERIEDLPFLPISLFRSREIVSGDFTAEAIFKSSGTTGQLRSMHYVRQLSIYKESFIRGFSMFYGDPSSISIFALLPSYLERQDSSLVYMADHLIRENTKARGGFFLDNHRDLLSSIESSFSNGEKVLLLGVSFALLELAENYGPDLSGAIVMETGGMKGRRKEMIREELHSVLMKRMNIENVHSEYGMTELLSQAWSKGKGVFNTPPWMRVIIRDPLDPGNTMDIGRTGGINIIDLANIYSCSFIETSDLGILNDDGSFEVTGRFDESDIRGCNLLI